MKTLVVVLILALCVLHHDVWWWDTEKPIVFGFIPIGLAWHAFISLAAAAVWLLAVKFCWPAILDADEAADEAAARPGEEAAS